jgi:hypothetical protein
VKVSAAEAKANKEIAQFNQSLNSMNQYSPFGSIEYTSAGIDPLTGAQKMSQTTNLSPQMQALLDSQMQSQTGIGNAISGAIDRLPTGEFNPDINVDDVRQRSFDSQMALLAPEFEKGWTNLESTMSDRGIPIGAEIWNDQTGEFNRARDSSLLGAARQADLDAGNEFQRQYGNELTEYNLPLQQLTGLMGNSQSVGNPQFSNYAQSSAQAPDVAGNTWKAYQANVDRYNQQQGNMMGGILGLGKLGVSAYSAGMFSDIRLKRDITRVGELPSGLPVYSFKYVWSDTPQIGVMAQEALHYKPEAVTVHQSGFLMVNYGLL